MRVYAMVGVGMMLAVAGCIPRKTAVHTPAAIPATTTHAFTAVAVPVYRLVANSALLDAPSRLLVVQLRVMSSGDDSYTVTPGDLTVALPDGTHARVFDNVRASELLRRTMVADADMSYLLRPNHLPGGVGDYSSLALAQMIQTNLLADGTAAPGQPVQGYIVIDTGQAVMSLQGASFEVIARRVGDYAAARYAYQVATTGPAEATGTP
jgi:hypothetical protein